jgi:hypothetical protein
MEGTCSLCLGIKQGGGLKEGRLPDFAPIKILPIDHKYWLNGIRPVLKAQSGQQIVNQHIMDEGGLDKEVISRIKKERNSMLAYLQRKAVQSKRHRQEDE